VAADILIYTVLAVLAGMIIIPFVIGLVRGPEVGRPQPDPAGDASLRPLGRLTGIYLRFLALYGFAAVVSIATGPRGRVCAPTWIAAAGPRAEVGGTRPGAVLQFTGDLQACARHPSAAEWILHAFMRVPGPLALATVLLITWQLVREARQHGPFTARGVKLMWRLGVAVLIGAAAAGAVSRLSSDLMLQLLMTNPPQTGAGIAIDALVSGAAKALLPIPALAGVALLSFARISRAGLALDEEVKATV